MDDTLEMVRGMHVAACIPDGMLAEIVQNREQVCERVRQKISKEEGDPAKIHCDSE